MTAFVAFLLKLGFGGIVDKAISHLEARARLEGGQEALRLKTTAELAKAAMAEADVIADLHRQKMRVPWFWLFAWMFLGPLALWWTAVILDSVFAFPWQVADLPTPQMQEWAGNMIQWVFYSGIGVGVIKQIKGSV